MVRPTGLTNEVTLESKSPFIVFPRGLLSAEQVKGRTFILILKNQQHGTKCSPGFVVGHQSRKSPRKTEWKVRPDISLEIRCLLIECPM